MVNFYQACAVGVDLSTRYGFAFFQEKVLDCLIFAFPRSILKPAKMVCNQVPEEIIDPYEA